jgi:hypothetical protein
MTEQSESQLAARPSVCTHQQQYGRGERTRLAAPHLYWNGKVFQRPSTGVLLVSDLFRLFSVLIFGLLY